MLERTGARTALLITEGFRDTYEIGRINRPDSYNLFFRKHVPLVERALRFEVRERMTATGEVLIALDEAQVNGLCDRLEAEKVDAVAILLLHCYVNPVHEERVKRIVRERLPRAFVTASHELSQEYREFERCSTTVANAYIGPRVSRYVADIDSHIKNEGFNGAFLLVQSTGGLYQSRQAQTECVRMLESGPAAGVVGAQALCRELKLRDAVAFDMGGTTAKAGVIYGGEVLTASAALVGRLQRGAADPDPDGAHLGGRHRRRQHRRARRRGCAARRAAKRRRRPRPGLLCARRHAPHRYRRQPGARPARRRPLPRRRDEARRGRRAPRHHRACRQAPGSLRRRRRERHPAHRGLLHVVRGQGRVHRARAGRRRLLPDRLRRRRPAARLADRARDRHVAHHRAARARPLLRLRHAALGPALRLRAHLVHAPGGRALRRDRAHLRAAHRAGQESARRQRRALLAHHRRLRRRHALRRPGAPGDRRPVALGVQEARPRCDQAPLRRGAPAALRHQRTRGARRDRQPARHRDRPHEKAASGTNPSRRRRAIACGATRYANGFLFGQEAENPGLCT